MAKRIQQLVKVALRARQEGGTEPARFLWEGRRYRVHSVDAVWKEMGRWWDGEGEMTTFRVTAAPEPAPGAAGVYELCYRQVTADWTLAEIQD